MGVSTCTHTEDQASATRCQPRYWWKVQQARRMLHLPCRMLHTSWQKLWHLCPKMLIMLVVLPRMWRKLLRMKLQMLFQLLKILLCLGNQKFLILMRQIFGTLTGHSEINGWTGGSSCPHPGLWRPSASHTTSLFALLGLGS